MTETWMPESPSGRCCIRANASSRRPASVHATLPSAGALLDELVEPAVRRAELRVAVAVVDARPAGDLHARRAQLGDRLVEVGDEEADAARGLAHPAGPGHREVRAV